MLTHLLMAGVGMYLGFLHGKDSMALPGIEFIGDVDISEKKCSIQLEGIRFGLYCDGKPVAYSASAKRLSEWARDIGKAKEASFDFDLRYEK
jgi:hypothetical protein